MTTKKAIRMLTSWKDKISKFNDKEVNDCIKFAIKALKKQNPYKVERTILSVGIPEDFIRCNGCYHEIKYNSEMNYCPYCGQALDWSDYIMDKFKDSYIREQLRHKYEKEKVETK